MRCFGHAEEFRKSKLLTSLGFGNYVRKYNTTLPRSVDSKAKPFALISLPSTAISFYEDLNIVSS